MHYRITSTSDTIQGHATIEDLDLGKLKVEDTVLVTNGDTCSPNLEEVKKISWNQHVGS